MTTERFKAVCREVGSEGIVLIKNDSFALPLAKNTKVSVFGRIQSHYIKSGTGSGGLVNVEYVVNIPEGLKNVGLKLNEDLRDIYTKWENENPFDRGNGWAKEPWSQVEMPLTDEIVRQASKISEAAIVIIGRSAGEEHDNSLNEGSYLLSRIEEEMLEKVTKYFEKVIVVLNVGNIIDMKWVSKYNPSSVMYVWQGGQEGGNAVADVIVGNVTPSGKLSDTIAYNISDYPSDANFGNVDVNYYCEDIYIGYRYFNSFAKDKVIYPFGFGLSYTDFIYEECSVSVKNKQITVGLTVKNTGNYVGKDVIQVYCRMPQGKLGKPERSLVSYKKTKSLQPTESQRIECVIDFKDIASFDDVGKTGYQSCFVLEKGRYDILICKDCMTDVYEYSFELEEAVIVKQSASAMSPMESFERMISVEVDGKQCALYEKIAERKANNEILSPRAIPFTGNKGIKLSDVKNKTNSMEEFIAQLSVEELSAILFGEGMNSPKVTGGTGCAFGGLIESLYRKGVPIACGTDGPSGLRMDNGAKATSVPSGVLLACTWNDEAIERLFTCEGEEMKENNIDVLLGPGMNIHRHPLCGRNFEYFSEDPYLTGKIGYAVCKGLANAGVTGTIKHFCGNNQETNRHNLNSVISERALREIYLKPFEIAVESGNAVKAIMTSYNPVNGIWTAGNYDLTTTILREEWEYTGFVMSDWWARTEYETFERMHGTHNEHLRNYVPCVKAQNDIYMCCPRIEDTKNYGLLKAMESGNLSLAYAQRNAMNICNFLMNSTAMERYSSSEEECNRLFGRLKQGEQIVSIVDMESKNEVYFYCEEKGAYVLEVDMISKGSSLSQSTVVFQANNELIASFTTNGTNGKVIRSQKRIFLNAGEQRLNALYPENVLSLKRVSIFKEEE